MGWKEFGGIEPTESAELAPRVRKPERQSCGVANAGTQVHPGKRSCECAASTS